MNQAKLNFDTADLAPLKTGRRLINAYGMCEICGIRPKSRTGTKYKGRRYWKRWCEACRPDRRMGQSNYRQHLQMTCQRCGFEAVVRDQMDVHHRDGNHKNNSVENLESLCANCHRLEHAMQRQRSAR